MVVLNLSIRQNYLKFMILKICDRTRNFAFLTCSQWFQCCWPRDQTWNNWFKRSALIRKILPIYPVISPERSILMVECGEIDSTTVWLNILPLDFIQGQSKYDTFLFLGKGNWGHYFIRSKLPFKRLTLKKLSQNKEGKEFNHIL